MVTILELIKKKNPPMPYTYKNSIEQIMWEEGYQACIRDIQAMLDKER